VELIMANRGNREAVAERIFEFSEVAVPSQQCVGPIRLSTIFACGRWETLVQDDRDGSSDVWPHESKAAAERFHNERLAWARGQEWF
jgi:hypothetical protein